MKHCCHANDLGCRGLFPPVLQLAVAGVLAVTAMASALAQDVPYQSERRRTYGTGFGQEELPLGGFIEPRLDWAVQYADNINLDADGGENAFGIEAAPGIYASYRSDRLTGAADYSLIGRLWDDSDLNDVTQRLQTNGRWFALPELLSFDAEASYSDAVIDYRQGGNYGGLGVFNQANLTDRATFAVGPTLRKRFKDVEFQASYSYGRVWYLDDDTSDAPLPVLGVYGTDDSVDQIADVSLGLVPGNGKLTGRAFYTWQHSDFEQSIPYEFERAGLEAGYELTRTLAFVGDVGKESDLDASTTAGGLDSDFWSAGLLWSPDSRTSAEARYGERFFGSSYLVSIRHTARFLEFTASYSEAPEIETRQLSLGQFDPGNLPPVGDPGTDFGRFNASPYVLTDARAGVSANGRRTNLSLEVFYVQRDYLRDLAGGEEGTGVTVSASREFASNVSMDLEAWYTDYSRDSYIGQDISLVEATQEYDTQFIVRGNREFGPRLSASLEAGYFHRAGTIAYDGWWVGLRGRWIPDLGW